MKVPKRISELLVKKQAFIDSNRDKLEKSVIRLQEKLLNDLLSEIIPSLDIKNGIIQDTNHNYRVLSSLDSIYKKFTIASNTIITSQVASAVSGITGISTDYFKVALSGDLSSRFDKIVEATINKMNLRIGLQGGNSVSGGFLETIIKDNSTASTIKNYVSKSVTGQIDTKDFIKGLTNLVTGEEGPGALEKQYQRYAYDLYQQYDRAYNGALADEFNMNYFIYQGGLIEDSRDFCAAHNNKVWTREEATEWINWTPSQGDYPLGYEIKQKDLYKHPSYMDYPGYQPLVDFGGYRCRHGIGWISDELAYDLRPDLKT